MGPDTSGLDGINRDYFAYLIDQIADAVKEMADRHGTKIWGEVADIADADSLKGFITRAGEELGGRRGLEFYMQRTAIQGFKSTIEAAFGKPAAE